MPRLHSENIANFLSGSVKGWWYNEDGTIWIVGDLYICDRYIRNLPFGISSVDGKVYVECPRLLSVNGLPVKCHELHFSNCFFNHEYYVNAIEQSLSLEAVVLEAIGATKLLSMVANVFSDERQFDVLKDYFPIAYQECRGRVKSKKLGF